MQILGVVLILRRALLKKRRPPRRDLSSSTRVLKDPPFISFYIYQLYGIIRSERYYLSITQ